MPDTKITALAAITTVDPAADVLPIVDISDTSMAASGTTKKITSNQILGAGGTATLASATITGDLTVDTSTLKVDSTNNRVGIGTASPAAFWLHVNGGNGNQLVLSNSGEQFTLTEYRNSGTGKAQQYWDNTNSIFENYLNSTGAFTWKQTATELMRLNSTGLGVGVSPAAKLHVEGSGPQARFSTASAVDARHEYYRNGIREGLLYWNANVIGLYATQSSGELVLASANTIRVRINSAGDTISNVTGTAPTLATNSQMVFNLTSNTNLRISVRGTDGVTRTADLTLA